MYDLKDRDVVMDENSIYFMGSLRNNTTSRVDLVPVVLEWLDAKSNAIGSTLASMILRCSSLLSMSRTIISLKVEKSKSSILLMASWIFSRSDSLTCLPPRFSAAPACPARA